MRMVASTVCLGILAGTTACLRTPPEPPPPPPDPICHPPTAHFTFVGTDTQIYRQGATIRVTPRVNQAPGGTPELPLHCTSDWTVTGPATLSADRTTFTIAPDAPVGSTVSVAFRHAGTMVRRSFTVVGRDEIVLTGTRTQRGIEGCDVPDRIGELEFNPGNRFSVTFNPFESYRDYWGSYSFDPATGRLTMTVEGGNFVPVGLDLDGTVELGPDGLLLRDMFLGTRQFAGPQLSCTYRF